MTKRLPFAAMICLLVTVFAVVFATAAGPDAKDGDNKKRPDIYDRTADGEKQIATALIEAKHDHKRVLLQFGANWCGWCHKLHDLFAKDEKVSRELKYEYVVVHIDVDKVDGKPHNAAVVEKYGNPTKHGLPVLVVLDEDGKQLTTQETGSLEEGDHHDPSKVLSFLKKWHATPPSADELLSAGLVRAKSESKAVFVDFSAPWCGWCNRLDEYLHRPEIAKVFDAAYVTVKIDVDRYKGGKEMNANQGGGKAGLPFFVILDAEGKKIGDSFAKPGSNVGFPGLPEEIAHFIKIVRQTSPKLSDSDIAILESGLNKKP